ncbi:MAG: hypothetical protein LBM13_04775, partial [Candidatus Ancillula sp.]|nr:hypothetical protein [Candidatus Ancillula sp.]
MADKKSSDGELKTEILKKVANSVNPALGEAIEKTVTEKLSTEKTIKPKTSHKLSTKTQSVVKPVVKKIEKEDIKVSDTESKKKTAPKTIPVKHSNTSVSAHKPTKIKPAKKTLQTATDINGKKISEQVKKSVASEKTSGDFKAVRRINSVSQTSSKVSVKSATHSSLSSKKPDSHSENGNTVHNSRNNIEHTSHSENNSQNGSSFNSSNNLLNSSKTAKRFFENKQFRNRIIILAVVLIVVILIIAAVVNNGKKMIGNFLDDGTSRLDYSEIVNLVANGNCPDVKQDENKTGHDTGLNKDSGKEIVFKHIETCASTSDSSKTVSSILNSWMSHTKYNLYLHSFEFDSPEYEGNNPKSIITSTKSPFEGCGYRVESVTETLDRKYANECKDRLG